MKTERTMSTSAAHALEDVFGIRTVDDLLRHYPRKYSQGSTVRDEDDLMPYEVLDAIERAAIRDKHTPLEVYREARAHFPAVHAEQMLAWVERFFRLWCRNQWKRERYAPSFHVDDENLDPKTWCRFPILSGGFERELRELREYVAKG